MGTQGEERDAATEAAQNVVENVSSYQYSAEDGDIAEQLDEGLREADVKVDDAEKERLVGEIHDLRNDEDGGTPHVDAASPRA